MKLVKNFALAVLLVLTLVGSVPAGELGMPGYTAPPPPPGASSSVDSKYALCGDPDATVNTVETSDYLLFEALAALLLVY